MPRRFNDPRPQLQGDRLPYLGGTSRYIGGSFQINVKTMMNNVDVLMKAEVDFDCFDYFDYLVHEIDAVQRSL